jgi:hypothetical protein
MDELVVVDSGQWNISDQGTNLRLEIYRYDIFMCYLYDLNPHRLASAVKYAG